MPYIVIINKYFQQVESEGQWNSQQQSLEDFDQVEVWGLNLPNEHHDSEFSSEQECFSECEDSTQCTHSLAQLEQVL